MFNTIVFVMMSQCNCDNSQILAEKQRFVLLFHQGHCKQTLALHTADEESDYPHR